MRGPAFGKGRGNVKNPVKMGETISRFYIYFLWNMCYNILQSIHGSPAFPGPGMMQNCFRPGAGPRAGDALRALRVGESISWAGSAADRISKEEQHEK